ncbi:Ni/Fe-hydrogenase, b-type cytochrome subunit [Mesoterricola sediminis]|uniref:Ni/Fe-hydrogenase B-type cytochrome subunit n=1 Tax=Mesoterricola sediminis TaxID=2927980 RepID=A0AA48KD29_9BACT|nr:Ni/Fe-hydrogenase, b-type cytochrome subunit [Mesoterricola sediminis]BDU77751.1 putative Ni/Fe-hydrogenase B-type cytochrome subunit [Mesoterricola sediminis]
MTSTNATYRRVYVWELPVRAFHWINGIAVALLMATGFAIGNPVHVDMAQEASGQYWFGAVRFVHFTAAWVFLVNFAARIYWGFAGNQYASWKTFIPTSRGTLAEILEVLKVDIFQTRLKGHVHLGHNPLAGAIYFGTFFLFLFQVATGFALYAPMSGSWVAKAFAWVVPLLGGDQNVRQWHHIMLWFYVLFCMVHIYLVFYHDYIEGRGTTSSMVGGWKFERKERREGP